MVMDDTAVEEKTSASSPADVMLSLENLIKTNTISIDRLKLELKKHREMLEDAFQNDPTYKEHAQKAKEAAKVKSGTKTQITKQTTVAQIAEKVKSLTTELKDKQLSNSDYLREYQRMSGASEIEVETGDIREIVNVPKLVRKSS